jgi:hypothetical protein
MNLRAGPNDQIYTVVGVLPEFSTVRVIGRNADTQWLFVEYEDDDGETQQAWIAGWLVEPLEGDASLLPVLAPWGATPTPGPTPAGVPIVAMLFSFASEEAMDMVALVQKLEEDYGSVARFVYIDVDAINDYGLYNRIYEGSVPALGLINRNNVLRQVITGTVAEPDLRVLLEDLLAVDLGEGGTDE